MSIFQNPTSAEIANVQVRSEEAFRIFVEAVQGYAIFVLDPGGHVQSWNTGAQRIKGYEASEIIGQHFSRFYPEEDLRAGKPERELEVAALEGRFEDEGWRVRKDGTQFWANVIITAIRDRSGELIGFGKVTRDFTERRQAQEELRQVNMELAKEVLDRKAAELRVASSERSLRELSLYLLRSQDEERRRIGRDLHDSLGQYLAVLKMGLDSLASMLANGREDVIKQVAHCTRLAEDSITEVRTISYLLYPPLLDEMGLKSAIPWYLDGFAKRSNIETRFEITSDVRRLDRDTELALFRVLQESLTNVHRHSGSRTANIRLSLLNGTAILEIKDQGKGFPSNLFQDGNGGGPASFGVGLRGMNERMRQLGGKLEVDSSAAGTTVTATVPVSAQQVCVA
jgi:PAS domain S-box-containing protein